MPTGDRDATYSLSLNRVTTRHYRTVPKTNDDNARLLKLGSQLRRLREAAGQSQDALANSSGLHRTYVGAVERGERNPTFLSLSRYAAGLGLSVTNLVDGF